VDALGNRTTAVYNASGSVVRGVNPMGAISTTLYDAAGRVKATIDPLSYRSTLVYDSAGRMVALRDPNGNRTTTVYDAAGRAVAAINALSNRITTVFDAAGRRTALVDPNGHRTTFQYNADGTQRAQIDPLLRRTTYGYDAAAQRTWRLDARGIRTTYAYDLDGRLVARKPSGEAPATFAYDPVGNRTLMRDSTGRTTSIYDVVNRLCSARHPAGKVITLGYDAAGNRSKMTDPDGGRTTYGYDAAGRIDHLVNPYNERTTRSYDAAGRVTVECLGNGARASYLYDAAGQLTDLVNRKSSGAVLSEFNYAYDPAGNRARLAASSQSITYRATWSYDPTYQLTAEHRTGTSPYLATYVYDAAGNRVSLRENPNPPKTYTYDAANQLHTGKTSSGTTTYVYDSAGNLQVERAPGDQRTTSTWDAENRLTRVKLPSGAITTMVYDADGLRVRKEDSSGTKKFVWEDQRMLLETDGNDATQAAYTSLPENFGQLVSQRRGETSRFYHLDALGSVVGLTDSNQAETDCYGYDAFGDVFGDQGTTVNPFRYVGALGYYYDAARSQYYVRARHYDPSLGRWLSVDPLALGTTDQAAGSAYVESNPLMWVDPSGEQGRPTPGGRKERPSAWPVYFVGQNVAVYCHLVELDARQKKDERDRLIREGCKCGAVGGPPPKNALGWVVCRNKEPAGLVLTEGALGRLVRPEEKQCANECGLHACIACHEGHHVLQAKRLDPAVCAKAADGDQLVVTAKCMNDIECYAFVAELNCLNAVARTPNVTRRICRWREGKVHRTTTCGQILNTWIADARKLAETSYGCSGRKIRLP